MSNPSQNSTTHGCCALDIVILPTERQQDFDKLKAVWLATYNATDEAAVNLINELVAADWLYQRSLRTLAKVEAQIFAEQPDPIEWTEDHHKKLTKFQRYRTANQNAFNRARKAVEEHLKFHIHEHQTKERLEIAKSRVKTKPNTQLTFSECMTIMRLKADALRPPSTTP